MGIISQGNVIRFVFSIPAWLQCVEWTQGGLEQKPGDQGGGSLVSREENTALFGLKSKASFSQLDPSLSCLPCPVGLLGSQFSMKELNRLLFSSYKETNKPHHRPPNQSIKMSSKRSTPYPHHCLNQAGTSLFNSCCSRRAIYKCQLKLPGSNTLVRICHQGPLTGSLLCSLLPKMGKKSPLSPRLTTLGGEVGPSRTVGLYKTLSYSGQRHAWFSWGSDLC